MRYHTSGNAHSYRTPSYKRSSSLGGAFEKPTTTALVLKHIVGPVAVLAACLPVVAIIFAAIGVQ